MTYYRLRKREPLIALGSQQRRGGGDFTFCIRSTPPQGGDRFEHPRLAGRTTKDEISVPMALSVFRDGDRSTRSGEMGPT